MYNPSSFYHNTTPNMKLSGHTLFNNTSVEIALADARVQEIREVPSTDSTTWVAPALIDIQVNGFAGFDLNVATATSEDVSGEWCANSGKSAPDFHVQRS